MFPMKKWMMAVLLGLISSTAAADGTHRFYGYAYDKGSGNYLYTEVHEQTVTDGKWVSGSIKYYAADGALMGVKQMDFSQDPYIPIYELKLEYGYREAITAVGKKIDMRKQSKDKGEKADQVKRKDPMAADSGFHNLLRDRFADLMAGKTVEFRFIAAGNLDSYRFRAKRIEDTTFEGQDAVRLRAEPDSLLRFVAPALTLTYEPEQKRLLEYQGISNVHDPATGKAYSDVRIIYPKEAPADAPKPLPPLE